jgi:protease-4
MKKFLLGLLVGLLLAGLSVVILVFSLARFGERRPTIADGSTLVLKLTGNIPEKPSVEIPIPIFGTPPPATVRDVWSLLRNAASDSRIKALVIMPDGVGAGWGKLEELHQDILNFKKSGKPVFAYLRNPRTREYFLATAADQIYMAPEDLLDVKGLRAELMFFRKTLDKLGVEVEVYHVGKYKDAGDMFTQTTATPETLEVMNSVLDNVYAHLIDTFAKGRKKSPEEIRKLLDNGPFIASQALSNGLIDGLRFEDEMYGEVKSRLKQGDIKKVSHRDYLRSLSASGSRKKIALVVGEGDITKGSANESGLSDEGFTATSFIKQLRKAGDDGDVKGVILRINSPGGDAIASDEMLREVKLLSKKKPLVYSMSDLAASGGYYVTMTGDPIVAYPDTYTGSIGIIYGKVNLHGLYDKIGISKDILTRGQNADLDTDYHELTESGKVKLREVLDDFYKGFVGKAAASRKKSYDELNNLAQGRVWMGSQAKDNGLIDELGGIDRAIELVKKKAGIAESEGIQLVSFPGKRTIFEEFLKPQDENVFESKLSALLELDLKLWKTGGVMRLMPYRIDVH